MLDYGDFVATCARAKDSNSDCFAIVQGRNGSLLIPDTPAKSSEVILKLRGREEERFNLHPPGTRIRYEVEEFQRIIAQKDYAARDRLLDHSVLVSTLLEQARAGAGIHFPVDEEVDA